MTITVTVTISVTVTVSDNDMHISTFGLLTTDDYVSKPDFNYP